MLFTSQGWSVLGKTVPLVLCTAWGHRPQVVSKTLGIVFPNIDLLSGEYHIFIHITCIIDIVWML